MTRDFDGKTEGRIGTISKTIYSGGEIDSRIFMIKQEERAKYVDWLLEKVPYPSDSSSALMPRFLIITKKSLELYKETGKMDLLF
jgi:hypothetical protein|tara:strand:- start:637 stop:891 length:255 start_codon:yes stop_codon:yes gene_type:complete